MKMFSAFEAFAAHFSQIFPFSTILISGKIA
jgi:hypothetical protein